MIRQGLERLYDFQHADGGWGWWKEGESDHFMTAYVIWGLSLARERESRSKPTSQNAPQRYLDKELVEEETTTMAGLDASRALRLITLRCKAAELNRFQGKAFENLWTNRDRLNAYTRALLALARKILVNR